MLPAWRHRSAARPAHKPFNRRRCLTGIHIPGPMTPFALTDFRDGVRGLRRTPAVTLCALACLTLGLGATTAIASAIDQALIRRLPFRDPGKLITVYRTGPQSDAWPFSPAKFLD